MDSVTSKDHIVVHQPEHAEAAQALLAETQHSNGSKTDNQGRAFLCFNHEGHYIDKADLDSIKTDLQRLATSAALDFSEKDGDVRVRAFLQPGYAGSFCSNDYIYAKDEVRGPHYPVHMPSLTEESERQKSFVMISNKFEQSLKGDSPNNPKPFDKLNIGVGIEVRHGNELGRNFSHLTTLNKDGSRKD